MRDTMIGIDVLVKDDLSLEVRCCYFLCGICTSQTERQTGLQPTEKGVRNEQDSSNHIKHISRGKRKRQYEMR